MDGKIQLKIEVHLKKIKESEVVMCENNIYASVFEIYLVSILSLFSFSEKERGRMTRREQVLHINRYTWN